MDGTRWEGGGEDGGGSVLRVHSGWFLVPSDEGPSIAAYHTYDARAACVRYLVQALPLTIRTPPISANLAQRCLFSLRTAVCKRQPVVPRVPSEYNACYLVP